jgi:hypothetical protein
MPDAGLDQWTIMSVADLLASDACFVVMLGACFVVPLAMPLPATPLMLLALRVCRKTRMGVAAAPPRGYKGARAGADDVDSSDIVWRIVLPVVLAAIVFVWRQSRADAPAPVQQARDAAPLVQRFYNFNNVDLVRIGRGPARIVAITDRELRYIDETGADRRIDLADCARICRVLESTGRFPPADDTDWAGLAETTPDFSSLDPAHGCVGLRGAVDDPPWFQFLDRRRTQFEFTDYDAIRRGLVTPLGAAGWQTWDAS